MFEDDHQALSRRQLFTEALPRGLTSLVRGVLLAREEFGEWAAAEAAPLYRWSSLSPGLREALRELDELQEQMRRENPELDAAWKAASAELPDYSDPEAVRRYLEELEARTRRESEQRMAAWRARTEASDRQTPP